MKRDLFRPIIALGFAVLAICSAQAQSFNYASVDFPNAIRTRAWGINPGGVIVGDYLDSSRVSHGFLWSEGHYVTVDVPGSLIGLTGTLPTSLRGVSPGGDMVGGLYTDMAMATHGYVLRNGTFQSFDVPSSTFTQAWDINPGAIIVGDFKDSAGVFHGFLQTV